MKTMILLAPLLLSVALAACGKDPTSAFDDIAGDNQQLKDALEFCSLATPIQLRGQNPLRQTVSFKRVKLAAKPRTAELSTERYGVTAEKPYGLSIFPVNSSEYPGARLYLASDEGVRQHAWVGFFNEYQGNLSLSASRTAHNDTTLYRLQVGAEKLELVIRGDALLSVLLTVPVHEAPSFDSTGESESLCVKSAELLD